MIDLHPVLSGMPLASVALLVSAELLVFVPRLRQAREIVRATSIICCIVAATGAFLSGYQASSLATNLQTQAETALATHHAVGRFLLINSGVLATFFYLTRIATHGQRMMRALYYAALMGHVIITVWTGYLGGQLVFAHGVNVRRQLDEHK